MCEGLPLGGTLINNFFINFIFKIYRTNHQLVRLKLITILFLGLNPQLA